MKPKIFLQASLPRTGSTLLQNLIGQNPNFYVTPTSGLIDLILGTRIGYSNSTEAKAGNLDLWKKGFYGFCKGGLEGYAKTITDKPYILDKNRGWVGYYSLMNNIVPNTKVLFLVRDLRSIVSSMEKKFRKNPENDDGLIINSTLTNITTFKRAQHYLTSETLLLRYPLEKLNQAFLDKTANNFLFIKYEDLCTNPEIELKRIYEYLEVDYFNHNFTYIPQITYENDAIFTVYADHKIRNSLKMLPNDYKEILGEETCEWIYNNFKDYFDIFGYKK